jgi:hypothetical protein
MGDVARLIWRQVDHETAVIRFQQHELVAKFLKAKAGGQTTQRSTCEVWQPEAEKATHPLMRLGRL